MAVWFRRFGDIPGITYTRPADLDPTALVGYAAVPEVSAYEFEGRRHESLMWSYGDGETSSSPAHNRAFESREDSAQDVVRSCYEGLELPGEPSDYHFLIQGTASELWRRRRQHPEMITEVEHLCRLDLQLVETQPVAVTYDEGEDSRFFAVLAFGMLIELFEREGALHEALEVAELAGRYSQGERQREDLLERIAAVESEGRE
jgi:hypothetical protein